MEMKDDEIRTDVLYPFQVNTSSQGNGSTGAISYSVETKDRDIKPAHPFVLHDHVALEGYYFNYKFLSKYLQNI